MAEAVRDSHRSREAEEVTRGSLRASFCGLRSAGLKSPVAMFDSATLAPGEPPELANQAPRQSSFAAIPQVE